jgi:hypothetical protein
MSAFGQLESAWPAFGSQLVQDGKVYCCAGRSMNLSSGVYMYALDVKTGTVLVAKNIAADLTSEGELKDSVLTDILVGDEQRLHMRGFLLNTQTFETAGKCSWSSKKKTFPTPPPYIEAYCGFLDSSWYNDSYLIYRQRSNVGHLLALDKAQQTLYGLQGYKVYKGGSNVQDVKKVGADGYRIFSRPAEEALADDTWSASLQFRGLAMVTGKDTLYVVGAPDKFGPEDDPWKHLDGRGGAVLAVFAKENGEQLFDLNLEAGPVFDGMAAAYGELFISCNDGTIQCYGN